MMKKFYEEPIFELVEVDEKDIITASGDGEVDNTFANLTETPVEWLGKW